MGAVGMRYMLPCHCKLVLCDKCVTQISSCLYHRQPAPRPQHHYFDQLFFTTQERDILAAENVFLKKCLHAVCTTASFVLIVNTAAYVMGGIQCGVFVSFFIAVSAFIMVQIYELDVSPLLQAIAVAWFVAVFLVVLLWMFNKIP